ncbi:deoxyribodipyrimidine photo-lyase [soil metagenome]
MPRAKNLVWFRSDLRLDDNPALFQACQKGETLAVFTTVADQWAAHDWGRPKIQFMLAGVRELHGQLAEVGVSLYVLECQRFDDCVGQVLKFAKQNGIERIYFSEEYEVNEQLRDAKLVRDSAGLGIECLAFPDQTILPIRSLRSPSDLPYKVFTPFKRNWQALRAENGLPVVHQAPTGKPIEAPALPDSVRNAKPIIDASRTEADRRLSRFLSDCARGYADGRNRVDQDGTSVLSPYLAAGIISARTCVQHLARHKDYESRGAQTWLSELIWRDFYRHITFEFPHVCKRQPFRPEAASIQWENDESLFVRWQKGQTGVPIVDAAMRCLNETGWMHNRHRMVVAMYLTKDLLIDWRWGERYFMNQLIDADFASNNGGWQWSASTGNDAAPYFRVFNPLLQAEKCDPNGDFVRNWVPELAELAGKAIHNPSDFDRDAGGYPTPIVDHALARNRAISVYAAAFKK